MNDERWHAIDAMLDRALDQPQAQREAFVRASCADDVAMAERVLKLLASAGDSGDFLEQRAPGPWDTGGPPDAPSLAPGTEVGAWRIRELIGRGGMGEVYLAERADGQFRQRAALKLMAPAATPHRERFLRERQILAELEHPGIARLLDGGVAADGRPYMAMEHVRGDALLDYLAAADLSLRGRLQLFREICDAVAYAHRNLVVHRDIKPANVVVDADGHARLLDFGIARMMDDKRDPESTTTLATPSFAAPEQLTGGRITTATDVYGLGGLLFAMLAGRPPFLLDGLSLPRIIDTVLHQEAPPPSSVGAGAPYPASALRGDLDAICLRALRKAPQQRYASAQALSDDVARHLQGLPVLARQGGYRYRLGRYLRRNALGIGAASLVLLSLVAGLVSTSWQARKAAEERDAARRQTERFAGLRGSVLQLFRGGVAEASSTEISARELFSRSAARINSDFAHDPATAAVLTQMLGELLLYTEDYGSARMLLERALGYPGIDEAVLADVRYDLAQIAYRDGDLHTARTLYQAALETWDRNPERYTAERIWSATMASQLARAAGDTDTALEILRDATANARAYWGEAHQETGVILINLAVAHYYDNQLVEALSACEQAWAVWQAIGRTESPDALNLLANWGLFALRHGDLAAGETRLEQALELRERLYGPSAALASLLKNVGEARWRNGRDDALQTLQQASEMAAAYAGTGGALHASASYTQARALMSLGRLEAAESELRAALDAAAGREHLWLHACRALLGEIALRRDRQAQAAEWLDDAIAGLEAAGTPAQVHLALALASRGELLVNRGAIAAGREDFERAIAMHGHARGARHYETLLLEMRYGRVLSGAGVATADTRRANARAALIARFGPEHPLAREPAPPR